MVGIDESYSLLVWKIFAVPITFVLAFLLFQENPTQAILLLMFGSCNLASLFLMYGVDSFTGLYSDVVEASSDWDDNSFASEGEIERSRNWMLIGLACLFVSSLGCGLLFSVVGIMDKFAVAFWVPNSLYPLSLVGDSVFLALVLELLTTWACVVPGEEGFKNCFIPINKAVSWDGPFAFQPNRIVANIAWALLHVILGQNNVFFVVSVFLAGCIMDTVSAQSGTIENNYRVHALFNSILIVIEFVVMVASSGAITLIWG